MIENRGSRWRVMGRVAVGGALLVLATCTVTFPPETRYSCVTDADCGGGSWKCLATTPAYCCEASGPEVCDGKDNDCDGVVDNTKKFEICNGVDDDCDGEVDEGFNVMTDPANCGTCGHACAGTEVCSAGACTLKTEMVCDDAMDNDGNGKTDCADAACEGQVCGTGCVCKSLDKTETLCNDGADNDGDALNDCVDPDCVGLSCGSGCACASGGGKKETSCFDTVDNDGDGKIDCMDPDCVGQACAAPPVFFTCNASGTCTCAGGFQSELALLCRDGIDNDCNGKKDCEEATCDTASCSPDGGADCTCAGKKNKETNCANQADDDGDGQVDCADADCPQGTACKTSGGAAGTCSASKSCE